MPSATARWEKYGQLLADGLLTVTEVTAAVLDDLADADDWTVIWAKAPEGLRVEVVAYIECVGPSNLPHAWVIGVNDPEWQAAQTVRRQKAAVNLLASIAERGTDSDPSGI